jgi:hypothetical protein
MGPDNTMGPKGQTIQWDQKARQYNGAKRPDNTMGPKGQTIQWGQKDRQYNGAKRTDNTMGPKGQTMIMHNTTQKTKD